MWVPNAQTSEHFFRITGSNHLLHLGLEVDRAVIQDTQYKYNGAGGCPICNMYIDFPGTIQYVGYVVHF